MCTSSRHDSEDDKSSPHKKRKKKKKGQETPPTQAPTLSSGKYKKPALPSKSNSKTSDLYNPESPTPTKDGSHDGNFLV